MELWFSDYHTEKVKVSVKVQKQLFGLQTEFQRIDVFDSDEFGRFLSADGSIVFSEKDEFIYDEMIVHVPMAVHPHVKNVLVIGGGDTGNDCQGTALRQGCTDLVALEMMPQPPKERAASNPWPEWPRVQKVDYGQTECLAKFGKDPRVYQTTVKEFLKDDAGNLTGAIISYLKPERNPETGRTSMVPTGEEFTYNCQLAFIAAGFTGCESYVADAFGVELTARGNVADHSFKTNVEKVFVCGDMRRGQSLVVWGLREGRDCAAEVDRYLMGYTNL
mgnify:CR=1 FL=1